MIVAGQMPASLYPAADGRRRACGCAMRSDRFLAMLASFHQLGSGRWTDVGPLTDPLHWTCGADAIQQALQLAPRRAGEKPASQRQAAAALRVRRPVDSAGTGAALVLLGG